MSELSLKTAKSLYLNLGETIREVEISTDEIYTTINRMELYQPDSILLKNSLCASMFLNFICLDICAAYRMYLSGTTNYEQRFAVLHLYSIMNEGFKRLYGFPQNKSELSPTQKDSIWHQNMSCYRNCEICSIEKEFLELENELSTFKDNEIFNKDARNCATHDSKDYKERYAFLSKLNAEEITKSATNFLHFLELWRRFLMNVQKHLLNAQLTTRQFK